MDILYKYYTYTNRYKDGQINSLDINGVCFKIIFKKNKCRKIKKGLIKVFDIQKERLLVKKISIFYLYLLHLLFFMSNQIFIIHNTNTYINMQCLYRYKDRYSCRQKYKYNQLDRQIYVDLDGLLCTSNVGYLG